MDRWLVIGVFLLGAGVGALTTAALYSAQIRKLRVLVETASHHNPQGETQTPKQEDEQRKSA